MNASVQAEIGSSPLASSLGCARRVGALFVVVALAVISFIGSPPGAQASDPPLVEFLPEFAYDVHLAPSVPSPPASSPDSSRPNRLAPPAARRPIRHDEMPWQADLVRVYKAERRLVLFAKEQPIDEFQIALGTRPIGPKRQQGDGRTPEGRYVIDWRKADSDFYRALHISYPNENDRRYARERGFAPGGSIMIHGLPNGLGMIGRHHVVTDWTDGCIAVTNEEISLLWERIPDGVPIEILP